MQRRGRTTRSNRSRALRDASTLPSHFAVSTDDEIVAEDPRAPAARSHIHIGRNPVAPPRRRRTYDRKSITDVGDRDTGQLSDRLEQENTRRGLKKNHRSGSSSDASWATSASVSSNSSFDEHDRYQDDFLTSRPRYREYHSPSRTRARFASAAGRNATIPVLDESDVLDEAFDFVIPRRSASLFSQDSTVTGSESKDEMPNHSPPPASSAHSRSPEASYNILRAQYTGDGTIGGEHRTQLTAVKDLKRNPFSLYRWVHFNDQAMNFDAFRNTVISLPGLSDGERSGVARLLGRVRRKFDSPYQASKPVSARMMVPSVLQEDLIQAGGTKQV